MPHTKDGKEWVAVENARSWLLHWPDWYVNRIDTRLAPLVYSEQFCRENEEAVLKEGTKERKKIWRCRECMQFDIYQNLTCQQNSLFGGLGAVCKLVTEGKRQGSK